MKSFDILSQVIAIIEAGQEWGHSGHLPPQKELQRRFRASNSTITEVIKALHARGYILHKGRGTIINPHRLTIPALVSPSFDGFLRAQGITPYMRNIGMLTQGELPADIGEAFENYDPPSHLEVIGRTRVQGEQMPDGFQIPYRISHNSYPAELAAPYADQAEAEPTFNLLAALAANQNLHIEQSSIKVWSSFPSSEEQARLLLIENYVPTIEWYRICRSQSGQIIMMSHLVAPAYRFCIEMENVPTRI